MEIETLIILTLAPWLLVGLLYFERRETVMGILPVKTSLSLLFIVIALVQPDPFMPYSRFLIVGLFCCLVGDVLLAFQQKRMFLGGLGAFLMGHVFYALAFFAVANLTVRVVLGAVLIGFVSTIIYRWLRPHLGNMRVPVVLYVVVISLMVMGALALWGLGSSNIRGRIMVLIGVCCFYASDVFVARDRFIVKEFINRLVGLPLYYGAQFLLALSVSFLK